MAVSVRGCSPCCCERRRQQSLIQPGALPLSVLGPLTGLAFSPCSAEFIQCLHVNSKKLSHCFSSCCDRRNVCQLVGNAPLIHRFQSHWGLFVGSRRKIIKSNQAPEIANIIRGKMNGFCKLLLILNSTCS